MWGVFEKTFEVVKMALKLRGKRHTLIASNIANVDTPGYRRKDLPFEKIMQSYLKTDHKLKTTNVKHLTGKESMSNRSIGRMMETPTLGTPNNVSLEEEITALIENQMMYESTLQALAKELERLREVITEGGR